MECKKYNEKEKVELGKNNSDQGQRARRKLSTETNSRIHAREHENLKRTKWRILNRKFDSTKAMKG
jgi:hypothetical protein